MNRPRQFTTEEINTIIEHQLAEWPMARDNFFALGRTLRRPLRLGALDAALQHNPARIRSTGAAVDAASIASRSCFLCAANRPSEQIAIPWPEGWELLVNPYPILPVHFTVASVRHTPQAHVPLDMAAMAEGAPDLAFFFNGARAGASAPDHLHVQAVLKSELPIVALAEKMHDPAHGGFESSAAWNIDLPFHFISGVVTPDRAGMAALMKMAGAFGVDALTGQSDRGLVNAFFWIGSDGLLRTVAVPRRRHRPACYDAPEGERLVISPGAVDMAGIMVAPRREDFDRLDSDTIRSIYAEVAFADALPRSVTDYFEI